VPAWWPPLPGYPEEPSGSGIVIEDQLAASADRIVPCRQPGRSLELAAIVYGGRALWLAVGAQVAKDFDAAFSALTPGSSKVRSTGCLYRREYLAHQVRRS